MKKVVALSFALAIIAVLCFAVVNWNRTMVAAASEPALAPAVVQADTPSESAGQAALKKAAGENKHLFLFVSDNANEETATAKRVFEAAAGKLGDAAQSAFIDKNQAAEKAIVEKYQLSGAPMPLILALAPNGVVTSAYFGDKLKDPQLQDGIAGPAMQQCLKALQDKKLVFLCLQNAATTSNDVAMQGVNDFKADSRFAEFTEVVKVDPAAAAEQNFLAKLKLDPKMTEATTAFLAPPGALISKVSGATTKDALVASLQAASSGGCGPKGCGPKGCAPKP